MEENLSVSTQKMPSLTLEVVLSFENQIDIEAFEMGNSEVRDMVIYNTVGLGEVVSYVLVGWVRCYQIFLAVMRNIGKHLQPGRKL